jgi:hypothetical protein
VSLKFQKERIQNKRDTKDSDKQKSNDYTKRRKSKYRPSVQDEDLTKSQLLGTRYDIKKQNELNEERESD